MTVRGTFCERPGNYSKAHFDRRSFRWIARGKNRLLIGCPRGKWMPGAERCRVAVGVYKILTPVPASGRCKRHGRKIRKG